MAQFRPVAASLVALGLVASPLLAQTHRASAPEWDTTGSLRAGDVVRVKVWREPDLSGDFTVDAHDSVVLPKLGTISVAGRSPAALKDTLLAGYGVYLRNPSIELTFLRRITVLGAVRNPGLYTVDPTVTVIGALALAGGVAANGNTSRVDLVRDEARVAIELDDPEKAVATALRSGDQLVVPQRSWLSRNTWLVAVAMSTAAGFVRLAID